MSPSKQLILPVFMIASAVVGVVAGYQFPRDEEIESTKPIVMTYEITPEAQKALLLRSVEGFPKCEAQ